MTALRRRHALMRSLRGLIPDDGRKTFRRNERRAPHEMPDWRVTVLLPERLSLVAPGKQGGGVTVEPDPFTGPLAVSTGKSLEWCCIELGRFLMNISGGTMERVLTATVTREGVQHSQQIIMTPEAVEFPQPGGARTWRVPR